MNRPSNILGILSLGLGRCRSKIVPYLVLLREVQFDLFAVPDGITCMEFRPDEPGTKFVIFPGKVVHSPLGVELFLSFPRRRQGDGVRRCLG